MTRWAFLGLTMLFAGCSLAISESDYVGGTRADGGIAPSNGGTDGTDGAAGDSGPGADGGDAGTGDGAAGDDLLAVWSFDTVSGNRVPDASGNDHDGTLGGTAKVQGSALVLGSVLDAMFVETLEGPAFPRTGTLSIHFTYDFDGGQNRGLVSNFAGTNHLFLRRSETAPATQFEVGYQRANTAYALDISFTIPRNVSSHVVFTWSEAEQAGSVYLNGTLVQTMAYQDGAWAPSDQVFRVGDDFVGSVGELRLYNVAKSAAQIPSLP